MMTINGTRGHARLIRVGEFHWKDASGKDQTAIFNVRTCGEIDRRFDDYNAQFTSAFDSLSSEHGNTQITYTEYTPCAIY